MTLHHSIDPNSGAAGVTLAIARALEQSGCSIDLYSFDDAFGNKPISLASSVQFPLRLALHLAKHAKSYDVVDASSGDAGLWASLGRPGALRESALVTRSHGLEQVDDRTLRAEIRAGRASVRRRYYIYHGGFRLWEVSRSIQLADRVILLNEGDREFTRRELHVAASRSSVVPHAVNEAFFNDDIVIRTSNQIRLVFVGSWIERKGIATITATLTELIDAGLDAKLLLLGARPAEEVLKCFPSYVRSAVSIVPTFENTDLPRLLREGEILLSTSRSEGFPLTLIEGMAAGLAPLSTPAGAAPEIINHGRNGLLLPYGDATAFARAVAGLARDRARLSAMRFAARDTASCFRWKDIAQETIRVYRSALQSRSVA